MTPTLEAGRRLDVLEGNAAALAHCSPAAAALVRAARAREDLTWVQTPSGAASATIEEWDLTGTVRRALASRRDPIAEAKRLADKVDVVATPVVVVMGFGLGYHVGEIVRRMGRSGVVVVFEPDAGLLRAVLETVDHSGWLSEGNVVLLTDPDDEGAMAGALRNLEGAISMGVQVIEHPASQARLAQGVAPAGGAAGGVTGGMAQRFVQRFTRIVKAARTTMVTTMVQSEATLRNLTQNVDVYGTCPGVGDLAGLGAGRAAIVVSAGPSLRRNIEVLSRPEVRERCVIIATQTVLRPLLERGIRPHFVTALDFHEISRRFYEGLTPASVEGVTLVIDPKVNPAVPAAYPGTIRCVGSTFLDRLLGPDFTRPMGSLPPGATVAHLAYYLARHLGCDPVILVGQDLGFTDGQYYSAGAVIHDVWAGELNPFRTLEMLEWERIVRMRGTLRRERDVLGRPVYTDEQMSTYLLQFQRDFKADADRGLLTIDATEGGVAKAHTTAMALADALANYGSSVEGPFEAPHAARIAGPERAATLRRIVKRIQSVRRDVWRIGTLSREARAVLDEMLAHHEDQARVNRLIGRVDRIRDEATSLQPAFSMVEVLNQTGVFNRVKADRRIRLNSGAGRLSPMEVQREQIERDRTNVRWIGDAADALGTLLDEAVGVCEGKPRRTRDPARAEDGPGANLGAQRDGASVGQPSSRAVAAVIPVDPDLGGLGVPRDLRQPVLDGKNPLQLTLARLARCAKLDGVVLLAADADEARRLAGDVPRGLRVDVLRVGADPGRFAPEAARGSRLLAAACWRGGVGNLTAYDESLWPASALAALRTHGYDAALVLGPEWALIDPSLCDAIIERHMEMPDAHRVTFSQAAPGLAPCLVDARMLEQIAARRAEVGTFASIGGVLGYVPTAPSSDFIAKPMCLAVPPGVRDAAWRAVLDTPETARVIFSRLAAAGVDPRTAGAEAIAGALGAVPEALGGRHVTVRVTPGAGVGGLMEPLRAAADSAGAWAALSTVTITGPASLDAGAGADVLDEPEWETLVAAARSAGFGAVHLRTTLRAPAGALSAIARAGPEVVSVDLVADDAATYRRLTGVDGFAQARANLAALLQSRRAHGGSGLPLPVVVPRITRRDAVYGQIEGFYDYWTLMLGCAVIDPLPRAIQGERIEPLPLPALAAKRRTLSDILIGGAP